MDGTTPRLDPMVQLSIAIATTPGAFAFLLGAGVSKEAGIPSGEEILELTKRKLYAASIESEEEPTDGELEAWLAETGFATATYASMLEAVMPVAQSRRDYLANFFSGHPPGPTHQALARLAARGLLRVIVTTNFDPLMEDALRAAGVSPVVVTDDASLDSSPHRETQPVFLIKAHGDAGQLTMRNTPSEVAELSPRMTEELNEVCQHHGVITLGYSGRDPAINSALRTASPHFGLYWMARHTPLSGDAKAVVETAHGRVIIREGATEFVAELERRVSAWLVDPTAGVAPHAVRSEVINALQIGDRIGLSELLKRERRAFVDVTHRAVTVAAREQEGNDIDRERMQRLNAELSGATERRLASLFGLLEHDAGTLVSEEIPWLSGLADSNWDMPVASPAPYSSAPRLLAWWLLYATGTLATHLGQFHVVADLWHRQIDPGRTPLAAMQLRGSAADLSRALAYADTSKPVRLTGLWQVARLLANSDLVQTYYPELLGGPAGDGLLTAVGKLGDFSVVVALIAAQTGSKVGVASWWRGPQVHIGVIERLQSDTDLTQALSMAIASNAWAVVPEDIAWLLADAPVVDP